ncbi:hypothetical protein BG004_002004 [Podila humilis]|nr:hypothetical protein BG004_002004 [Podila humilis]
MVKSSDQVPKIKRSPRSAFTKASEKQHELLMDAFMNKGLRFVGEQGSEARKPAQEHCLSIYSEIPQNRYHYHEFVDRCIFIDEAGFNMRTIRRV